MPPHGDSPSPNPEPSHQGFTDLYLFLREAFQKKGLVRLLESAPQPLFVADLVEPSIPPEILQRFKQCPLQDIQCPDIGRFARLFEGTHFNNRFRLEANSFVYTVQILFHLRPNLVQERVLYLLMVPVRLLKDEKQASSRLSELAGREIDRYAVARKRALISNKLVPWLLKHFSQDSTIIRLKILAAQFLFHLLQGDEEAKNILGSAPQKDRWSLGRAISASPELPVRILAANVLREALLAQLDLHLFWSPDMVNSNDLRLPSSFIADAQWLHRAVQYLRDFDKRRPDLDESQAKTHEILSVRAGSLTFSDITSKIPVTVSDQLLFIIPAHQKRPLQILEISLVINMEFTRINDTSEGNGERGGKVQLQLQLRNAGFYKLNGFKGAVDQVVLSFARNNECDDFCHDVAKSLQKMPKGPTAPIFRQSDADKNVTMPRPKKQGRAVIINLSQDAVISGGTQSLSLPLQIPRKVSTSGHIDVSASTESSVVSTSPLQEISENRAARFQSEADREHLLLRTNHVQYDLDLDSKAEAATNTGHTGNDKATPEVRQESELEKLTKNSIALAFPEAVSQKRVMGQASEGHLLQMNERDPDATKTRSSGATLSNLQHVALEALHHSAEKSAIATPQQRDPNPQLYGSNSHLTPDQPNNGAQRPSSMPPARANSARRMALNPKSAQQLAPAATLSARRRPGDAEGKTGRSSVKPAQASNAVQSGGSDVDWDEDLREDQDETKAKTKVNKHSTTSISHNSKTVAKKSATTKKGPKVSSSRKKGSPKVRPKDNNSKAARVIAGLAALRPRRTAANVSYDEQSEKEDQSQQKIRETTEVASQDRIQQIQADAPSPNLRNDHLDHETQSLQEPDPGTVAESPAAGLHSTFTPMEAAVEVYDSNRAFPTPILSTQNVENRPLIPEPSPSRDRKGSKTDTGNDIPGRNVQQEVEVVDDSHPLDKKQRANAKKAAKKSFGSALADAVNQNDLRRIESRHAEVPTKPFGDKAAFVASVRDALEQPPKTPETDISASERKKAIQTLSPSKCREASATGQGLSNDLLGSARDDDRILSEGPAHQQLDEEVEITVPPQDTSVAIPVSSSARSRSPDQPLSLPSAEASDTNQPYHSKESDDPTGDDIKASSSWPQKLTEEQKPSEKIAGPASGTPKSDRTAAPQSDGRKRRAAAGLEWPYQVKRARKTDPGPVMQQTEERLVQGSTLVSQPSVNNSVRGISTKSRVSEPSVSDLSQGLHNDEASAGPQIWRKQEHAEMGGSSTGRPEVRFSRSPLKLIQSPANTPRHRLEVDHVPMLMDDDLLRKAHNVGFSAKGPRNQGVSSSGKRGRNVGQSSSVPTETGKHLAFKKLHTVSKPVERPEKAVSKPSQLFAGETKRKVQFTLSDQESSDYGIYVDEESADDATPPPTILDLENGKGASQTSKVDENGSPRLHLRQTYRISIPLNASLAAEDSPAAKISPAAEDSSIAQQSPNVSEGIKPVSVFDSSENEAPQTQESTKFGLEAAISNYTTMNAHMNVKSKNARSRPSIGVENVLDKHFPQAKKSIETTIFKGPLATSVTSLSVLQGPRDTNQPIQEKGMDQKGIPRPLLDRREHIDHNERPSFDIEQLNVSVAPEQPSSALSGRVRRLRSSTPESPSGETAAPIDSPPSFNTRLGKMVMPPPPRRDQKKMGTTYKTQTDHCKGRETSAMVDAETTLVNGEAFEETDLLSPQRQQRSSSSSSDEEEQFADSASQQDLARAVDGDRRFWNQKVAETQQTVLEILDQVSQKILLRFSSAEEGINSKLNHYHYGGRKIVNNLVEQFDRRVTEGKEMPSPRIREYRTRLQDTVERLQCGKRQARSGPTLDNLQKSHDKRTTYVLTNLQKLAAAQEA